MFGIAFFLASFSYLYLGILDLSEGEYTIHQNFYYLASLPLLIAIFISVHETFFEIKNFEKIFKLFASLTFICFLFIFFPFDVGMYTNIFRWFIASEIIVILLYLIAKRRKQSEIFFFFSIICFTVCAISMARFSDNLAIFSAFFANIFLVLVFTSASKESIDKKSGIDSYFILEDKLRHVEQALNASEKNLAIFKKFIERAKLGFGFSDLSGNILYANPTLCNFLDEKSVETATGKNVVNFYPKDFQEKLTKDILPYVLENENWIGELPLLSNKDRITPTIQNIFLIKNDLGEPEYFANVLTDITERKKSEEVLRKSEEKFKNIAERSQDVIVLITNDGKITYVSPSVSKVFGFSQEECIGKYIHRVTVKSDIEKISKDFTNSIQNKTYVENKFIRMNHKNGSLIYTEIGLIPIIEDGCVTGVQGLIRDITQNKKIEEILREKEERYRSMFDSPFNLIYICDFKGNFIDANQAALDLLGYEKEDIKSLSFSDLIDKKQIFSAFKRMREIQKKGADIAPLEFKLKCKDGSYKYVETISSIIKKDGKPHAVQGIGQDITERKEAEAEVKKAHERLSEMNKELERKVKERTAEIQHLLKQKDEFINQLGHDLKNPLNPIVNLLPVLEKTDSEVKRKDILNVLNRNVDYMKSLVVKTLELAKLNSTQTSFSFEDINLLSELNSVLEKNHMVFNQNNIKIVNNIGSEITIKADKLRLEELFDNIISNSVKYSPKGGIITFNAFKNEEFVTVTVKDTGMGMTKNDLKNVFEEFYKADSSRHDFESSGLGMTICKRIVEKHGGKIWVESDGLGKGSTFYFTIPSSSINKIRNYDSVLKEIDTLLLKKKN